MIFGNSIEKLCIRLSGRFVKNNTDSLNCSYKKKLVYTPRKTKFYIRGYTKYFDRFIE